MVLLREIVRVHFRGAAELLAAVLSNFIALVVELVRKHVVHLIIVNADAAAVVYLLDDRELIAILDLVRVNIFSVWIAGGLSLVVGSFRSLLLLAEHVLVSLHLAAHSLLLDDHAVKTGVQNLDNIRMPALSQDVDLPKEALQAFPLVDHVLDPHDLDRHLLLRLQVNGEFDPT